MRPYPECGLCMLKWVYERVANSLSDDQRFSILKKLMDVFAKELNPSINLAILSNRSLEAVHEFLLASSGSYALLKRKSNEAAGRLIREAKDFIDNSETSRVRFVNACGLAAVSNVAPIGVPSAPFDFSMVEDIIKGIAPLPAPAGDLYAAASKAKNVFYVADNAGEIGFDSLVISLLKEMGAKVTLVVKEGPFFDDATLEDVHYFGLEQMADAVHCVRRGIFVPDETVSELAVLFENSDLVISKGTGNFEALKGYTEKKRILFLLKAKCRPVAKETNTPEGAFVVRLEE
jgi:damage-control phosphatase, subfamily I